MNTVSIEIQLEISAVYPQLTSFTKKYAYKPSIYPFLGSYLLKVNGRPP